MIQTLKLDYIYTLTKTASIQVRVMVGSRTEGYVVRLRRDLSAANTFLREGELLMMDLPRRGVGGCRVVGRCD